MSIASCICEQLCIINIPAAQFITWGKRDTFDKAIDLINNLQTFLITVKSVYEEDYEKMNDLLDLMAMNLSASL